LSRKVEVEQCINLQLTGKISLKLDSNSSLLLEYAAVRCWMVMLVVLRC